MDELPPENPDASDVSFGVNIQIMGIGDAGSNIVDRIFTDSDQNLKLVVANTELKGLSNCKVGNRIQLGAQLTRGLGTGGELDVGKSAAENSISEIEESLKEVDLLFIVAGLGGGTGSGAAPVIADKAKSLNIQVITFVTLPFTFEGNRKRKLSEEALIELRKVSDAVVPLPNDLLLQDGGEEASVVDAFSQGDEWISKGVTSLSSILLSDGLVNVDFATFRSAFGMKGGRTLFGFAQASGENVVDKVFRNLMMCPLMHTPEHAKRADRLIVHVKGGKDLSMAAINVLIQKLSEQYSSSDENVFGAVIDESLEGSIELTVLGTTDLGGTARKVVHPVAERKPSVLPVVERIEDVPKVLQEQKEKEEEGLGTVVPEVAPKKKKKSKKDSEGQEEFDLFQGEEQRGYFVSTEKNLYNGEDLDVPTYLRRGIHIEI